MSDHLACVFPGQGSQSVGMLADLAARFPAVEETFAEASEGLGFELWPLCLKGPEAALNQTENTQPALLTAGVAVWRVWEQQGGARPALLAGHSLGEYTALVCAGALALPVAAQLVAARGRFMQDAVPAGAGAMAAIAGLEDEQAAAVCAQAAPEGGVWPSNFNCPGQVVIAGKSPAVARALDLAQEAGARRTARLPVSAPSHCPLMAPAAECLARHLETIPFAPASIPVVSNADARIRVDPEEIKQALIVQLSQPVQWVQCVQALRQQGVVKILECGPGKVLSGLIRRIDKTVICASGATADSLGAALSTLA